MGLNRVLTTVDWPRETLATEGPARGVPVFEDASCTACGDCLTSCPASCIILEEGWTFLVVDGGACVRCGRCVIACGEEAISLTGATDLAAYSRHDLVMDEYPSEERALGPSPSGIYRMAVARDGGNTVEPARLLEERESILVRRHRGD
jgi:formate hydrogenlyase subunit 6/NADH:ubiquinone oxidoreductase subunit I